jgi:hypothetical protein
MEVQVVITSEELEAIKAYADFMRDNEAPCDRKCGPPGSPDRRACCGCPEQTEWVRQVNEFTNSKLLTKEMLGNETVKRYIASYNERILASRALEAANKRAINAENAYQNARDAFTISAPVTVTQHKTQFVEEE